MSKNALCQGVGRWRKCKVPMGIGAVKFIFVFVLFLFGGRVKYV